MSRKNKSYPAELKYQAVADYLSGAGSLRAICKKYKIGNKKRLQDWIKLYNSHKELKCYTGGSRMTKGRDTTYEERIAFVKECIENGYNYTEISEKYKVGYQQIYTWVQKYKKDGEDALKDRRRCPERPARTAQERLQAADGRGTVEAGSSNFEAAALSVTNGD